MVFTSDSEFFPEWERFFLSSIIIGLILSLIVLYVKKRIKLPNATLDIQ